MSDNLHKSIEVLRYQEQRGLDNVPGYATGLQFRFGNGLSVYIALSMTELVLYIGADLAVHYDLMGRLVKVSDCEQFWRRSLSGRILHSRKLTAEDGGGLRRGVLSDGVARAVVHKIYPQTVAVYEALQNATTPIELARPSVVEARQLIEPILRRAAGFDEPAAARDIQQFQAIYGRVAVLPPDQYNALVLQATEGCAYAGCTFCDLYRGVNHRKKSADEFRQHIRDVIRYHGEGLRARRSIFLGEANALTLPTPILKDFFRVITEHFELPPPEQPSSGIGASWWLGDGKRFDGISSFLDAFTNTSRTLTDYRELRSAGLRRVYIGLESGDAALLKWLRKPATPEAVLKCVRLLKECDIIVGVIVLVGVGGHENAAGHVRETIRVLNKMPLGRSDYIYFSPLVVHQGSQYDAQALNDAVTPLTDVEMHQQEQEIRLGLRFDTRRGKPYLARYELEAFVY
ncbi:MAG: radical SAM protein [Verrucomicrobiota bacterium]